MDQRQHPIEQIMETTLENLKQMIDVNTIVGDSMVMADGTMIVPVSKVNLGFVSGGGEYPDKAKAGGKGAQPQEPQQEGKDKPYDRLAELIPHIFADIRDMIQNPKDEQPAPMA